MFWGFSKNLGGGFRIGIGGRLGGSRRSKGPTQRELQKQEKQEFLDNTKKQFDEAVTQWFISHGHLVMPSDALKYESTIALKINPIVTEFSKQQRLVRDGGSLTAKRRETMLESIYAMEELISGIEQPHPMAKNMTYTCELWGAAGWG